MTYKPLTPGDIRQPGDEFRKEISITRYCHGTPRHINWWRASTEFINKEKTPPKEFIEWRPVTFFQELLPGDLIHFEFRRPNEENLPSC